jgi:hypothetical protein
MFNEAFVLRVIDDIPRCSFQEFEILPRWGFTLPHVPVKVPQDSLLLVDSHDIPAIGCDRQRGPGGVGVLGYEEVQQGLLLVVAELVIAFRELCPTGVEVNVWRELRRSLLGLPVKDSYASEDTVLGPVPNDVSNPIRVQIMMQVTVVVENRRSWGHAGREELIGLLSPLVDGLYVALVHAEAELEEQCANLVHGHGDELNQPRVKLTGT